MPSSSWGGSVLRADDGQYHMWVSEMADHCGIGAWQQNSRIVHASASSAVGPYARQSTTWEVFAHEPVVVPGPRGEFVMYFTSQSDGKRTEHGKCNCCREGHSPCDGSTGPGDCPAGSGDAESSYMSWSTRPDGGWSEPAAVFAGFEGGDTNFSPFILQVPLPRRAASAQAPGRAL